MPRVGLLGGAIYSLLLTGCASRFPTIRPTGIIDLPAGRLLLHRPLVIPDGAHDLEIRGHPAGSTLVAAPDFQGRALIVSKNAVRLTLAAFRIEGNRGASEPRIGIAPSDVPFARYYADNGILVEGARGVTVRNVSFAQVTNYPLLVSRSNGVRIEGLLIEDCGSRNKSGHNNASGGILLEEGTTDFDVRRCTLRRVRGNGIWTHSMYGSRRNANGIITGNRIEEAARDAIQVGHATHIRVERNTGARIGYPIEMVDIASWAVPVAVDTAGDVDQSAYLGNHFDDINGQCIDLDGFHDGEVRDNACISRRSYDQYPYAQYGIVFNNSNPDAEPVNVTLTSNVIDGAGYGGIFLLGSGHVVTGNHLVRLNRDRCVGDVTQVRCNFAADQPGYLRSGIYLGRGAARPAQTAGNRIMDNQISGFGMERWCIVAAPGVSLTSNHILRNTCGP